MGIFVKNDCYLDLKALSAFSSLGVSTLREYMTEGLPYYKPRGKILIKKSEFEDWLCQFKVAETGDLKDIASEAVKAVSNQYL